ncbi:MAG: GNAT family N-acetyltransferase [Rhodospirillales bacterium]|nr:GNAT family N-acetyltransferase [Rhodospirillales bacterium]
MTITIRDLKAGDEADWRDLWHGYCEFYQTEMPDDITDTTWQRLLDAKDSTMFCLVACDENGTVAGFVNCVLHPITWSKNPVCFLEDLFVDPETRNKGTGQALISAVKDRGLDEGWLKVYWRTRRDNAIARTVYEKMADMTDWVIYEVPLEDVE